MLMENHTARLTTLPASLEDVKIKGLPSTAFYISEFLSPEEERVIWEKIATAPKPRWKQLSKRRLQTWPSDLNKDVLLESPLPSWLTEPVISRILSIPVLNTNGSHIFENSEHGAPNHVLINEYLPGQGIMPHKDGAAYHPVVCTVSLGANLCLDIYEGNEDGTIKISPTWKILQEPRSLLITSGALYTDYFHGIAETNEETNLNATTVSNWNLLRYPEEALKGFERKARVSLTYRDVVKVSKLGAKFAIFGKR